MPLVAESHASESFTRKVAEIVGETHVSRAHTTRAMYGRDMWPKTLLWTRAGKWPYAPDLVAWPANTAEVAALVRLCAAEGVPIVPFGGGGGVCGGIIPLRGGLTIDVKRMNRLVSLRGKSITAEVEAGLLRRQLQDLLQAPA